MFNNAVIKRTITVQAVIGANPSAGQTYNFEKIPNISQNNILLYAIEAYTATDIAVTDDLDPVVPTGAGLLVTLTDVDNEQFIKDMPYNDFIRRIQNGMIVLTSPRILSPTKSFVTVTDTTDLTEGMAAYFNILFDFTKNVRKELQ